MPMGTPTPYMNTIEKLEMMIVRGKRSTRSSPTGLFHSKDLPKSPRIMSPNHFR